MKLDARGFWQIALGAGVVVGLLSLFLIADFAIAAMRVPAEKETIEALEEGAKTDAEVAEQLHLERERQTLASLARENRGRIAAWALLVFGGAFVAAGQRWAVLRPQRLPSLDRLVGIRFDAAPVSATLGGGAPPVADDESARRTFVEELVRRYGKNREAAIPILQAIQNRFRYLPDDALQHVCELTEISPAQIAGTSSFYAQFRRSPVGRHVVRVCHGTACHVAGAEQITQELRRHLDIADGEDTDAQRRVTVDAVACVGCCSLAPVMMVEEETAGKLDPATARQVVDSLEPAP